MALGLIACTIAASTASSTLAGASSTVRAADALHAAPLFLSDVPNCETDNQCNNRNYDDVIHKTAPLKKLLLQCIFGSHVLVGLLDQSGNCGTDCNHNS